MPIRDHKIVSLSVNITYIYICMLSLTVNNMYIERERERCKSFWAAVRIRANLSCKLQSTDFNADRGRCIEARRADMQDNRFQSQSCAVLV